MFFIITLEILRALTIKLTRARARARARAMARARALARTRDRPIWLALGLGLGLGSVFTFKRLRLLQKRTDTRGVGISNMTKSIYLLTTTPNSHIHRFHLHPLPAHHTHTFHPLSTIVINTLNLCKVQSMNDNCGEWVECMCVASGCS